MSEPHRIIVDTLPELRFVLKSRERELSRELKNHHLDPASTADVIARLSEVRSVLSYLPES